MTEPDEDLVEVWGTGPADVFAVGSKGSILHFDGREWRRQFSAPGGVSSIWGSGSNDVYAGGWSSELLHYDGARWSSTGIDLQSDADIWGTAADDVYVVDYETIHHFDGQDWSVETRDEAPFLGIGGSNGDVIAFSTDAVFRRFEDDWAKVSLPKARQPTCPRAVWSQGDAAVVVGERGTTLHRDRKGWRRIANAFDTDLGALWGSGPGDVFALGPHNSIYHFDGRRWSRMVVPRDGYPSALFGFAADKVFAVGEQILTYDGTVWSATPNPPGVTDLWALWGSSRDDVWAVGASGAIVHYDGKNWVRKHPPESAIQQSAPPPPASAASIDSTPLCAPRDVTHDADYVRGNATNIIVEVLYENHPVARTTREVDPPLVTCGPGQVSLSEAGRHSLPVARRDSDGFLELGDAVLIRPDGAYELRQPMGGRPIHYDSFKKETFSYCGKSIDQERQPVSLPFDVGEVAIRSVEMICDDTGVNEVRVRDGSNWVELTSTLNVELFEYDTDNDQSKELYVISTQECGGWLRIMRIRRAN
ncbi:MAG: hypothetical protein HOW73_09430 [Polyangiaceae bacterium]|nr:hypothetical protein [Polyangiaceae bacterium]